MPSSIGGQLGRYELHGAIARGGMATVYVARMSGAAGFSRTVAVKRLHPHLAADPTFAGMFVDEARLAARIRHPNVIDTLDVVADNDELFLVMAFVLGETLSKLGRSASAQSLRLPPSVVSSIVIGALEGLHAAHEATDEQGQPLGIVHRDVSPQNILVARDGVARVIDFGVAKAAGRVQETEGGELKGKLAYMAPEQLTRRAVDRRCDVFAMGVVVWEALTGRRLFAGDDAASTLYSVLNEPIALPSSVCPDLPFSLDSVVLRALQRDPVMRFATARDMALAIEAACPPASPRQVGEWVERLAADALRIRADIVRAVEQAASPNPIATLPHHGPDDLASHPSKGGSGPQRFASEARLATGSHPSMSGISTGSGVSGVSGMTGTSGVTSSGYADPSLATRVHPMVQEKRLPVPAVIAICAALALMLAVGLITGIKALTHKRNAALATTAAPVDSTAAVAPPPAPTAPAVVDPAPAQVEPTAEPAPVATEPATEPVATAATHPPATHGGATHGGPTHGGATATPGAATAARTATPARPATPSSPKPAKPAADCENPFTVDANGVKRPKPECFGH
ncbi:MAG: serine/threonine protein kinase [Labilithrix sp.]|nr:serine/threonine protein kinase [Labilithrix sp.]